MSEQGSSTSGYEHLIHHLTSGCDWPQQLTTLVAVAMLLVAAAVLTVGNIIRRAQGTVQPENRATADIKTRNQLEKSVDHKEVINSSLEGNNNSLHDISESEYTAGDLNSSTDIDHQTENFVREDNSITLQPHQDQSEYTTAYQELNQNDMTGTQSAPASAEQWLEEGGSDEVLLPLSAGEEERVTRRQWSAGETTAEQVKVRYTVSRQPPVVTVAIGDQNTGRARWSDRKKAVRRRAQPVVEQTIVPERVEKNKQMYQSPSERSVREKVQFFETYNKARKHRKHSVGRLSAQWPPPANSSEE